MNKNFIWVVLFGLLLCLATREVYAGASNLTVAINTPPSTANNAELTSGAVFRINWTVNDSAGTQCNYTGISIYDWNGVVKYYLAVENDSTLNSQLTSTPLTTGTTNGRYYYILTVHDTQGNTTTSYRTNFSVGVRMDTGTVCNTTENVLWGVLLMVMIVGLVFFAYTGFVNGNVSGIVAFIVLLTVIAVYLSSMLTVIKGLC